MTKGSDVAHFKMTLYEVIATEHLIHDTADAQADSKLEAIEKAKAWAKKEAAGRKNLGVRIEYAGVLVDDLKL